MIEIKSAPKGHAELARQLGAAFIRCAVNFIPEIEEYVKEGDKQVSFGARVDFWTDKNENIRCKLVPKEPKLPTTKLDPFQFTLRIEGGQLSFAFEGEPAEPEPPEAEAAAAPARPKGRTKANGGTEVTISDEPPTPYPPEIADEEGDSDQPSA